MTYDPRKHGALCNLCPRRSQVPVPPEGPRHAMYVWIGQDPGRQEVKAGRPFVGATGTRLTHVWERALAAAGRPDAIQRKDIWVTNAALCLPITPKEKEARDAVTCCRPRLLRELRRLPEHAAVLMMGKNAWLSITGKSKGVGKYVGFHVKIDLDKMEDLARNAKLPKVTKDDDIPF